MTHDPTVHGDIPPPGEGERQAGLEQILRAVANGITVQDRAGRIVYANEAAARANGYESAAELLAAGPAAVLSKFEIRDKTGDPYPLDQLPGRRVMAGEPSARDLLRFRHHGIEEEYWAEVHASPIHDSEGNIDLVVNIFNDLTEQMKIEGALRESEMRYRHLVDTSPDAILLTGRDGTIAMANARAAVITGYADASELVGRPAVDLVVPEQRQRAAEAIEQILVTGSLQNAGFTILAVDGRHHPVEVNSTRIADTGSSEAIVTVIREISERQRLELTLREQAETLETLHEVGSLLAGELDLERLVQAVTDAATELTGARFGSFFYNVIGSDGDSYMLYTLSGVPREHFASFPMPRATELFGPTFRGEGTLCIDDVRNDPRYGKSSPYFGIPPGHLPVVSYLAVPVISRSGVVLGGLFFGHPKPGIFTPRVARLVEGLAAQAAVAVDNARLYETAQQERLEAERSREHYRVLSEAIPQIIWTIGSDGRVDYWNQQWFDYTGVEGDATGMSGAMVVHPDELETTRERWQHSLATGEQFSMEYRLRRHDGVYRWHLARALPLRNADGNVLRWFGTCTDIEDQKRAEETLRFLAEANDRLASLIDDESKINDVAALVTPQFADWCAIDLIDDEGSVDRVAVSHVEPEKAKLAYELVRLHPPDLARAGDSLSHVLISGTSVFAPEITEEVLVRSARSPEHLELGRQLGLRSLIIVPLIARERTIGAMTLVTSTSGRQYGEGDLSLARELAGKIAIALDNVRLYKAAQKEIEERSQTEIALKQAMERAEAANESKSRFLAVLSHELRTPLTPVMTALETLSAEELPEWVEQMMAIVRRNVELEARLIDDLLDLTRITRGKVQLQMESVDVHQLLRNVIEICAAQVSIRNIDLRVELDAGGHHIMADPTRLQQILCNLLNNAIKFTPEGGTVSIRTSNNDNRFQVEVSDTGIGIEPALLPVIFDAFEQGDESITRRYGGLGLGLAISRTLAEMHGGTLEASSEGPDKGSTFTMSMPATPAAASGEGTAEAPSGTAEPAREIRILLVDDHVDTSKVMKMLLERRGYHVRTADSVGTALEQVRGEEFDLMISDIGLPDGSGHDLMRTIRAEGRELKAVALSGFGMEEDIRRSMDAGFHEHLTKPVGVQKLQEVIHRLLA